MQNIWEAIIMTANSALITFSAKFVHKFDVQDSPTWQSLVTITQYGIDMQFACMIKRLAPAVRT